MTRACRAEQGRCPAERDACRRTKAGRHGGAGTSKPSSPARRAAETCAGLVSSGPSKAARPGFRFRLGKGRLDERCSGGRTGRHALVSHERGVASALPGGGGRGPIRKIDFSDCVNEADIALKRISILLNKDEKLKHVKFFRYRILRATVPPYV